MYGFIKSRKKGMTLAELLVVFVIMGIVASMTLMSAKPTEKSLKYSYLRTYNTLDTAFYNATLNPDKSIPDSDMDGTFPTKSEAFCKMLLQFINTADSSTVNCSANTIYINQNAATLNAALSATQPHFVASNGVRFWLAHAGTKTKNNNQFNIARFRSSADYSLFYVRYYIVIADLNGTMPPNTVEWRQNKIADRVAFIITEDTEVIPIGYPEIDTRYFAPTVAYASAGGVNIEDVATSEQMSYYSAKRYAWAVDRDYKTYIKTLYGSTTSPKANDILRTMKNDIYAYSSNEMSLDFYSGDENNNITSTGPFYIDYGKCGDEGSISLCKNLNSKNYTSNDASIGNCSTTYTDSTGEHVILDPEACYIKIPEYN